jgi:hypothetical protein
MNSIGEQKFSNGIVIIFLKNLEIKRLENAVLFPVLNDIIIIGLPRKNKNIMHFFFAAKIGASQGT